jgi:2-polyprenyl-6-methoxyphenol 4-hydroxylase
MSDTFDIVIIGGGMAGAGLALLLSQKLPDFSVALIEQFPLQVTDAADWRVPSFDARSTALSCSTQQILQMLSLWGRLADFAEPIVNVHVSERHRPLGMLMRASELALPALGYVIENRILGNVLLDKLLHDSSVNVISPAVVDSIKMLPDCAEISIGADAVRLLRSKLVVIADGAQSALRQQLGIAADAVPYDQHALIANLQLELPHKGIAYERFTDTGPIALLPLIDCEDKYRAALVWTIPSQDVDELMALPDAEFLQCVQNRLGDRCGKLSGVGVRHCYALQLVQAREQVRSRVVLLGSAAHHLHPVAGQGFNLIMRDCLALVETLADAGADPGKLSILQSYLQKQIWDQQKTVTVSDWLPRLFASRELPQVAFRSAALLGLDFLPGMRETFARQATGL